MRSAHIGNRLDRDVDTLDTALNAIEAPGVAR